MSLDVYLTIEGYQAPAQDDRIFIREDGSNREITREEWDERFPGQVPFTADVASNDVYSANITHNLNTMAEAAEIYQYLWRPDEIGIATASQLIEPLRIGLALLKSDPERFKQFNPRNGWGNYEALVCFVERYLEACEATPEARVAASR